MNLDFKITVWQRIHLHDDDPHKEEILKHFKEGSVYDIFEMNNYQYETLYDTEEILIPETNNGDPTRDILDDDGNSIWDNVNKEIPK